MTRRAWKDSHAQKFIHAFEQNKLIKALDKDIRYGGKQIAWCRLLGAPYKEQLGAMPDADLQAEGGMCSSVPEFITRYFKGDTNQKVWVIRFEFVPLEQVASTQTPKPLGVYSDSTIEASSNAAITLSDQSIHQAQLFKFSLCDNSASTTDSTSPITSETDSIHQTPVIQGGSGLVYSFWKGESIVNHYRYKVKNNGKWQVKSVYIPVGKLPKVKEAIANKLSVAAIVVEVLKRNL
ncbi:hypothetical protein [Microcoleus sp. T3_A4]|uniref:hypothetical protein n=1 Tax=Microcoleus sp. T3_A4 TaxID=2818968 RepID=UPI002FD05397